MAPGMVSFSKLAGGRTSMIITAPASSCFLSSSAGVCLAPTAHFVFGSTSYLRSCWAKEAAAQSESAATVSPAINVLMHPPFKNESCQPERRLTGKAYRRQSQVTIRIGSTQPGRAPAISVRYFIDGPARNRTELVLGITNRHQRIGQYVLRYSQQSLDLALATDVIGGNQRGEAEGATGEDDILHGGINTGAA